MNTANRALKILLVTVIMNVTAAVHAQHGNVAGPPRGLVLRLDGTFGYWVNVSAPPGPGSGTMYHQYVFRDLPDREGDVVWATIQDERRVNIRRINEGIWLFFGNAGVGQIPPGTVKETGSAGAPASEGAGGSVDLGGMVGGGRVARGSEARGRASSARARGGKRKKPARQS